MTCRDCELREVFTCRGCSNRLDRCSFCAVGPYCSSCQNRLIHNRNSVLTSPTPLETELKKDNQQLTTSLNLKDKELADLQAEIRALHTQLNEKENNSPFQIRITKLENKLSLIKNKLKK